VGRRHDPGATPATVALVRECGIRNVGLDLIAFLPGMTTASWFQTLERAVALQPDHLSVYALSLEPGTPLHERRRRGALTLPDDEAQAELLARTEVALRRAGLQRYEISNYAVAGKACLHNVACWRGEDYLGLGPGAASRAGLRRWRNRPSLRAYTAALERDTDPPREAEVLPAETDAAERFVFAFRLLEGADLDEATGRWAHAPADLRADWERTLGGLRRQGLVRRKASRWLLTRRGRMLADAVAAELMPEAG
jgi:oxygen-independent coproporphyrinogen-3 oxidase